MDHTHEALQDFTLVGALVYQFCVGHSFDIHLHRDNIRYTVKIETEFEFALDGVLRTFDGERMTELDQVFDLYNRYA